MVHKQEGASTTAWLAAAALASASGALVCWLITRRSRATFAALQTALQDAQLALEHEKQKRAADRSGRIRAEQELGKTKLALQQLQATETADVSSANNGQQQAATSAQRLPQSLSVYPFRPLGHVRSCFRTRNGTPRQPQLVPSARCVIELAPDIPDACLQGLESYSHAWILYVFHANTDLAKTLSAERGTGLKGKIRVPRLDGAKLGVLATRSPHRPNPIGLSVAKIIGVKGRQLILGGADVVDGSPVLDIKPYVPYCDVLPVAKAPDWVAEEAQEEPLKLSGVTLPSHALEQLQDCWNLTKRNSLYDSADEFVSLVEQVLSRDIRSVHQRLHVGSLADAGEATDPTKQQSSSATRLYHVVLDNVNVSYCIDNQGMVTVQGACLWQNAHDNNGQ